MLPNKKILLQIVKEELLKIFLITLLSLLLLLKTMLKFVDILQLLLLIIFVRKEKLVKFQQKNKLKVKVIM